MPLVLAAMMDPSPTDSSLHVPDNSDGGSTPWAISSPQEHPSIHILLSRLIQYGGTSPPETRSGDLTGLCPKDLSPGEEALNPSHFALFLAEGFSGPPGMHSNYPLDLKHPVSIWNGPNYVEWEIVRDSMMRQNETNKTCKSFFCMGDVLISHPLLTHLIKTLWRSRP